MKRPGTPLLSSIFAVALLLACVGVLIVAIALPAQRLHAHYDGHIENLLERAERYSRIAATRDQLEAQLAEIRARDASTFYLKHTSPSLAAAEIQLNMQELVESLGLKLESTQIAPHRDEGGHRKITVNFRMRGKLADIQSVLYRQTSTSPYRYVDNLSIQSLAQRGQAAAPGVEPEVLASFDLYGYALLPNSARQVAAGRVK